MEARAVDGEREMADRGRERDRRTEWKGDGDVDSRREGEGEWCGVVWLAIGVWCALLPMTLGVALARSIWEGDGGVGCRVFAGGDRCLFLGFLTEVSVAGK